MERHQVKSSNVVSVGYDPASGVLEVEFRNGSVYDYADVPAEQFNELLEAPSVGSFIAKRVRGQYPTTKLEEEG